MSMDKLKALAAAPEGASIEGRDGPRVQERRPARHTPRSITEVDWIPVGVETQVITFQVERIPTSGPSPLALALGVLVGVACACVAFLVVSAVLP